jgi:quinol monooxygenase YgiN
VSNLRFRIEFSVHPGKREEFLARANEAAEAVRAAEPGAVAWSVLTDEAARADEGGLWVFHEEYATSEALVSHLETVGPQLAPLFELGDFQPPEVVGDLSPAAAAALEPFGPRFLALDVSI